MQHRKLEMWSSKGKVMGFGPLVIKQKIETFKLEIRKKKV